MYPTPPYILTLMTLVPQNRLAIGPPALTKTNPTVCSLACCWWLRSALGADRESFSIESSPLLDNKALLYSYALSYSCIGHHPQHIVFCMLHIEPFGTIYTYLDNFGPFFPFRTMVLVGLGWSWLVLVVVGLSWSWLVLVFFGNFFFERFRDFFFV